MDSVYKLSKYSQKIGEACRAKQLDKVIEYNKHELAYINKLSKYFNNQKGGAKVEQIFAAIQEAIYRQTAKLEKQVENLDRLLDKAVKEASYANQTLQTTTTELVQVKQDNETLSGQIKNATQTLHAKEEELTTVKTRNLRLQSELNEFTREKESLITQQTADKNELKAKEEELATTKQQLQALQSAQEQGQGQELAQLQLQEELATANKKNEETVQIIEILKQTIEENMSDIKKIKSQTQLEIEGINARLITALQKNTQVKEIAQQAQEEHARVQTELAQAHKECDEAKQELTEVHNQAEQDQLQLGELKQELDTTKQKLQELLQKLNQQVGSLPPAQASAQATGSKGGSKRKK